MKVGSSKFNLTHERKFSCNFGQLVPIMCEDVVPGDRFSNTTELFVRLAPQKAPVMHRVSVSTHFFFVPNRLIWRTTAETSGGHGKPHNGWERFITGYEADNNKYIAPTKDEMEPQIGINYPTLLTADKKPLVPVDRQMSSGSIFDYLYGISPYMPDGKTILPYKIAVSALPIRAYNLIWNEWYRDEDLQSCIDISFRSSDLETNTAQGSFKGFDTYTACGLWHRCYEKDYFTSCRPSPQKGPAITVPTGESAPIKYKEGNTVPGQMRTMSGFVFDPKTFGPLGYDNSKNPESAKSAPMDVITGWTGTDEEYVKYINDQANNPGSGNPGANVAYDPNGTLYADLQKSTGVTINKLRIAFQVQKFLERNARSGARYVEQILSHFGVRSPDFRLDRPEFLGGGRSSIMFSEVLQTNSAPAGMKNDDQPPLGTMGGHGFSAAKNHGFSHSFTEHGWIIGLMSVMPRTAYQQGVAKRFIRKSRYDYYFPEFAHLGEQAVLEKEVFVVDDLDDATISIPTFNPDTGNYDDVALKKNEVPFGFQAIWDEYRKRESSVHGDFRGSLSYWHMGRIFTEAPKLNSSFVHYQRAETSDRVWGVVDVDPVWVQLVNHLHAIRKLPSKGIPGMLDHF